MTTSRCYQLQSVLIIFMLITINFVTSTDVSAVIHLILTGISVPFGLVFRRDRIVQTCDHSYVIIAIMLRITYCLSQSCVEYSLVTEFRKEIVRNERESSIQKGILFLEFFINYSIFNSYIQSELFVYHTSLSFPSIPRYNI